MSGAGDIAEPMLRYERKKFQFEASNSSSCWDTGCTKYEAQDHRFSSQRSNHDFAQLLRNIPVYVCTFSTLQLLRCPVSQDSIFMSKVIGSRSNQGETSSKNETPVKFDLLLTHMITKTLPRQSWQEPTCPAI